MRLENDVKIEKNDKKNRKSAHWNTKIDTQWPVLDETESNKLWITLPKKRMQTMITIRNCCQNCDNNKQYKTMIHQSQKKRQ